MKTLQAFAMTVVVGCLLPQTFAAAPLKTEQQKLGYAMGYQTGQAFKAHHIKMDPSSYSQGLKDALNSAQAQMSEQQIQLALDNFQKQNEQKVAQEMQAQAEKNQQVGEAFLAKNKTQPGVITTDSGLQYKILNKGDGPIPTQNDTVVVDYEGKLIDGKIFDSSYRRGQPITLPVSGVISGWQEALTKMPVGSTWELYIPSNLAYGKAGALGAIGPNETLIFKVHLIRIKN